MSALIMQTTPPNHPTPPAAQPGASWPTFRHDHRNTGLSVLPVRYTGDQPWTYPTGKGIFSTPVIDREGVIYVGSADHYFYSLGPDGALRWKFKTGEIIDSAAALPAHQPQGKPTVVVPSADGHLYCLDTTSGEPLWTYDGNEDLSEHFNNWFEGNVALGPDGTLYAGNTNFNYYALTPEGDLKWIYRTGSNAWSAAGITPEGTIIWGSCDTFIHGVSLQGKRRWRKRTLGFVAASAAVSREGPVYIGSFDSRLYALDPASGNTLWTYRTGDHIYSSAALLEEDERTRLILFGSADGSLYALTPEGELAWSYDTGAPIRSSPVIGPAPGEEDGWVVYFGSGIGKLYALNAETGRRRWSYDTTPEDPAAAVRNDLNGSPALSPTGILIGGEHGRICYLPYDYPLYHPDPRANLDPGEDLPEQAQSLYYVSPGGGLNLEPPPEISGSTVLSFRLLDREDGQTRSGRLTNAPLGTWRRKLVVNTEPELPLRWEVSPDGRHLHLIPEDFLDPGTRLKIHIQGDVYRGGLRIGNLKLGGRKTGAFADRFQFLVREDQAERFPLLSSTTDFPCLEWTRLAVPLPTMLPSLNQIGFDYLSWLIGPAAAEPPNQDGRGRLVCWAVGARRDQANRLQVDPDSDFIFPLAGEYRGSAYRLTC